MYHKKKHIIGLLVFISTIRLFIIPDSQNLQADQLRARLLDGFAEDCRVIRSDGKEVQAVRMLPLYSGDRIIQVSNIASIKIKIFPFVSIRKLNDSTLQVVYEPPNEKTGVLKEVIEFMGLVAEEHKSLSAAARSIFSDDEEIFPLPGYAATVMPKYSILFAWDEEGSKSIVFINSAGQEVFRKPTEGKTKIGLTPDVIGMRYGESYQWRIEGILRPETHIIRLLSEDNCQQVQVDLKKIDAEQVSELRKKLKKCSYLQLISDTYEKDIDLYWMAYQFLRETAPSNKLTKEERDIYYTLMERHIQHLKDTYYTIANPKAF